MNIEVTNGIEKEGLRFVLSKQISKIEKTYDSPQEAVKSPVAHKLFGFPWTESVRVGADFVEVVKKDWVAWDVLREPLEGLLKEHFSDGDSIEENPELSSAPEGSSKEPQWDDPVSQGIQNLFNDEINPSLASHGGFVKLLAVEGEKAFVEMGGGCQGCAMSMMTLKEGIETAIKGKFPQITQVLDKTDHSQGDNPFYKE